MVVLIRKGPFTQVDNGTRPHGVPTAFALEQVSLHLHNSCVVLDPRRARLRQNSRAANPFHLACVALAHSKCAEVCPTHISRAHCCKSAVYGLLALTVAGNRAAARVFARPGDVRKVEARRGGAAAGDGAPSGAGSRLVQQS